MTIRPALDFIFTMECPKCNKQLEDGDVAIITTKYSLNITIKCLLCGEEF